MSPDDTTVEAAGVQRLVWARLGPARRLELALTMSDEAREIAITGVMRRRPELSRRAAELLVVRQALGPELFEAAYGPSVDVAR